MAFADTPTDPWPDFQLEVRELVARLLAKWGFYKAIYVGVIEPTKRAAEIGVKPFIEIEFYERRAAHPINAREFHPHGGKRRTMNAVAEILQLAGTVPGTIIFCERIPKKSQSGRAVSAVRRKSSSR